MGEMGGGRVMCVVRRGGLGDRKRSFGCFPLVLGSSVVCSVYWYESRWGRVVSTTFDGMNRCLGPRGRITKD